MNLLFYSDYISTSRGGGERHILLVALVAAKKHQVSLALPGCPEDQVDKIRAELSNLVGQSLSSLKFIVINRSRMSRLEWWSWLRQFDGLFWVSDGSLPWPVTVKRYLHLQIPFTNRLGPVDWLKLQGWSKSANVNSAFTQSVIEQNWRAKIPNILWPLVDVRQSQIRWQDRSPKIISIGRFFKQLHSKRQDVLVEAFRQLNAYDPKFAKYHLILIGAVEDQDYFESVKKLATDLPVEFKTQVSRIELEKLLGEARYYWHATGFEVDEVTHPMQVEHFGMSVAEGMMAGCLPLVVPKGGSKEVLGSQLIEICGWQSIDDLIERMQTFENDRQLRQESLDLCQKQVKQFGQKSFAQRVEEYFRE